MSSSPPPTLAAIGKTGNKKKKKSKTLKDTIKPVTTTFEDDDISGDEQAYEPPKGSVLLTHDVSVGEFDWDAVQNDDDVELWVLRVPEGVRFSQNAKTMPELNRV